MNTLSFNPTKPTVLIRPPIYSLCHEHGALLSDEAMVGPSGLVTYWANIDQKLALRLLERVHKRQRVRSARRVQKLKFSIKTDNFPPTHQGILFDRNGFMIDGQHRVEAISKSDVSVPIMITENATEKVFHAIDGDLAKRTVAHRGQIAGRDNTVDQYSMANFAIELICGVPKQKNVLTEHVFSFLDRFNSEANLITSLTNSDPFRNKVKNAGFRTAIFLALFIDRDKATEFCRKVSQNAEMQSGDPEHAYVSYITRLTRDVAHVASQAIYPIVASAILAKLDGRKPGHIKPNESRGQRLLELSKVQHLELFENIRADLEIGEENNA